MRAAIDLWWQRLAERERRLVVVGTSILVAVLVYMTLWEPAADGVRRLRADLPQLRAQEASLRGMATEASTLRAAGGAAAAVAPSDRVAAVRRSLQRAGLWREASPDAAAAGRPSAASGSSTASSAVSSTASSTISTLTVAGAVTTVASSPTARFEPPEIVAEANDRVRVRFADIDYGVWVAWLASTETELATRAARVSVAALAPRGPVGHVKAEALLDWSQAASLATSPAARP